MTDFDPKFLRRSQLSELGQIIREFGLDPDTFKWDNDRQGLPTLHHPATGSFFSFIHVPGSGWPLHARYQPTREANAQATFVGDSWSAMLPIFRAWAALVFEDATAAGFYAAASWELEVASLAEPDDDAGKFEEHERQLLASAIDKVEARLCQNLGESDQSAVRHELWHIREALDSMQRGRWRRLVLGSLLTLVLQGIISSDAARDVFVLILEVLSRLPGLLPG